MQDPDLNFKSSFLVRFEVEPTIMPKENVRLYILSDDIQRKRTLDTRLGAIREGPAAENKNIPKLCERVTYKRFGDFHSIHRDLQLT